MARFPNLPRHLNTRQVLVRFFLRVIILTGFAAFGSVGFGRSLAALLWMAIILCVVVGTVRREPVFRAGLNHWDEAVAYAAIYALVTGINQNLSS